MARSNKPIVITRSPRPAFNEEWEVRQGEGEDCNHSTGHSSVEDALLMARILMQGILKDEASAPDAR